MHREPAPRMGSSHLVLRARAAKSGRWRVVGSFPWGTPRDQAYISEKYSLPFFSTQCYISFYDPVTPLPLLRQNLLFNLVSEKNDKLPKDDFFFLIKVNRVNLTNTCQRFT